MSILNNSIQRVIKEYHEDDSDPSENNICRVSSDCETGGGGPGAGGPNMEAEKRIRREIANSNERRRMQSINAGFQSLRTLLPHHEGEKLSKAAILQQTAEYIYNLEQEKTRLLSQNSQLMRQVQQHEGGDVPPKKRIKTEIVLPTVQAVSESSDEGLGSISPEPLGMVAVVTKPTPELSELRRTLEQERSVRAHLEEQLRNLEAQLYQQMQYQEQSEEIRESIVTVIQEPEEIDMQLINAENVPLVGQTETVVCSPQLSPNPSVSRAPSPVPSTVEPPPRLPSVLEAAIKAEPKVEVERLPSPASVQDDVNCGRIYVANTSRQNLETIVEAIRHLEGDHLFGDEPQQEAPLALTTTKPQPPPPAPVKTERLIQVEMNPYLQFHTTSVAAQQQQRPGVIVVKQNS